MHPYENLFIIIMLMIIVMLTNRFLPLWLKIGICIYYMTVAVVFVKVTDRINEKYAGITPVPYAYWAENSNWVYTVSNLLFLPFIVLLIFIYIMWLQKVRTKTAKTFIALSLVPAAFLIFVFYFFFNLSYGYGP